MADETNLLIPVKDYLKTGMHIGTKFKNKAMMEFVYKVKNDGLAILNLKLMDERLKIASDFLSQYQPEDILIVCRRDSGRTALKYINEMVGIKVFPGRYPPGMLINSSLRIYKEAKIMVLVDTLADKNALVDAKKKNIPIVALCDVNNTPNNVDLIVPCNNKGKKSIGGALFLLMREYMLKRKLIKSEEEMMYSFDDFIEN